MRNNTAFLLLFDVLSFQNHFRYIPDKYVFARLPNNNNKNNNKICKHAATFSLNLELSHRTYVQQQAVKPPIFRNKKSLEIGSSVHESP